MTAPRKSLVYVYVFVTVSIQKIKNNITYHHNIKRCGNNNTKISDEPQSVSKT